MKQLKDEIMVAAEFLDTLRGTKAAGVVRLIENVLDKHVMDWC